MRASFLGLGITAGLLCVALVAMWISDRFPASVPSPIRQLQLESADRLTDEQVLHARTIIAVGRGAQVEDRAIVIALMTALQESSLRNLDHGDRDSRGLFQQRPSQGWGTEEQVQDPIWAAQSFYGVNPAGVNPGLLHIPDWEHLEPGDAAQAVQRSAYPDAFDKWLPLAEELVRTQTDVEPIG